jgi:hypothetical protein
MSRTFVVNKMSVTTNFDKNNNGTLSLQIMINLGENNDCLRMTFGDPGSSSIQVHEATPSDLFFRLDQFQPVYAALKEVLSRTTPEITVNEAKQSINTTIANIPLPITT